MSNELKVVEKVFENKQIRTIWNGDEEKFYISVVDIVSVLTDNEYQTARNYWKVLKNRLRKEGNETVTNCNQLKLLSQDGKQTPTHGHPVFVSEHATATCCRECLYKWHHIRKNHELSEKEIDYVVKVIMTWIKNEMTKP